MAEKLDISARDAAIEKLNDWELVEGREAIATSRCLPCGCPPGAMPPSTGSCVRFEWPRLRCNKLS